MKKTVFLIMAVMTMGLAACNGECTSTNNVDSLDSVDSTQVDSVDSTQVDSVDSVECDSVK